ncbi:hypothetical protein DE146DRAFT_658483 [Phaeosphaeria sp. MPI-PUGE-AT-0046c]|nr:hypothetical protein DE146DRAFT_658483 [Phaeosphaeria sp. MPI-PUGE-AT-0046c]
MSSYFDLPPQQKATATNIETVPEEQKHFGRMNVLSPAVTQLLEDLGKEDSDSDSASAEGSASDHEVSKKLDTLPKKDHSQKSRSDRGLGTKPPKTSLLSPASADRSPTKKKSSARSGSSGSSKPKQPHMARFHSLRSMLFSNTIEGKMQQVTREDVEREEAAAEKWKSQHDQRQVPHRPKTPEKDAQGKPHGLGSRLKTSIRRMTTKEVPTMVTLKEDGAAHDFSDHGSTASSDNEEPQPYQWKPREADEESIDHSDVEDLVRWVSRRDPPSDGEARAEKTPAVTLTKADSGHDSIGDSDVDELVRFASRKSTGPETMQDQHTGYSDASTESDSELLQEHDSSDDEDADDLVRWISHRNGPTAGPVRSKQDDPSSQGQERHNSDVPEFGNWVQRSDGSKVARDTLEAPEQEPERGRPLSREGHVRPKQKHHITDDDINDLVKWVSRKDSNQQNPSEPQAPTIDELQHQEDLKKKQLGMSVDEGSLSHSDVKELIEHVRSTDVALQGSEPTVQVSSGPETGDINQLRTELRETKDIAAQDHLNKSRGTNPPVDDAESAKTGRAHSGSLGPDDVDELVRWVSARK